MSKEPYEEREQIAQVIEQLLDTKFCQFKEAIEDMIREIVRKEATDTIDKEGASRHLGSSVSFVETCMAKEGLPYLKTRKKITFRKSELTRWQDAYRQNINGRDLKELADEAYRTVMEKEK